MRTGDKIIRLAVIALFLTSGIFVAHQSAVTLWLVRAPEFTRSFEGPQWKAPLYVGVRDVWSSFRSEDAAVEVISADKANRLDTIVMIDTYTAGTMLLVPKAEIYLHVYSLQRRSQYYDAWYHVIVGQNQPVKRLRPGLGTRDAPAPIGQFDEEDYGTMSWYVKGNSVYWYIAPVFFLSWRNDEYVQDINNVKFTLENPEGLKIRTATGLVAASDAPDSAGPDFTAARSQLSLKLNIELIEPGRVYGQPMLFLGPAPDYDWQIGYLVIWISFNNTRVGSDYLTANGWTLLSQDLAPGCMNFYRVLPAISGSLTSVGSATIDIHIDTGGLESHTAVSLRIWVADLQVPADAAAGKDNAAPTPSGGAAGCGIASTIFANGFQVVSGRPTRQLVWAVFETA